MKKILSYIGISQTGWVELIFAFYPILSAYRYGPLLLYMFIPILFIAVLTFKNLKNKLNYQYYQSPYIILLGFVIIHELLLSFDLPYVPSYFWNSLCSYVIIILFIIVAIPHIKYERFVSAINIVAVLSIGGILYQYALLAAGNFDGLTNLTLPFMPEPSSEDTRFFEQILRPSSFFVEPQAYVSFMIVPMFIALISKQYIWAALIAISILISGSTTGIAMICIMMLVLVLSQPIPIRNKVFIVIIIIGLYLILQFTDLASSGLQKMNDTELDSNIRVMNGFLLVQALDIPQFIWGVPYANAAEFYANTHVEGILGSTKDLFVSTFWNVIIRFGIIGLLLYLRIYYKIFKRTKKILPFLICILVTMFTNPDFLGANYAFSVLFMITFTNYIYYETNFYGNNAIRK